MAREKGAREKGYDPFFAAALVGLALIVAAQFLGQARDGWFAFEGRLLDPDGYMRLLRVERLVETGAWLDQTIARSNAPYGETLHWTRPLDVLLIAGAAPLAPFLGWRDALFAWGVWLSPALHVATLLTLLWAARPLLGARGLLALAALFPLQLFLSQQFSLGRPDHHGLLLALFAWQMGLALRGRPAAAGPAALALWVSVEALPAALAPVAFAGVHWLARGEGAGFAARYAGLLTAGIGAALLVERGPGALAPAYDSLSVVHLTLAGLIALAALGAMQARRARWLAGLALTAAAVAAMALLWPEFFAGPLAQVEPRVVEAWFDSVAEVEPPGGALILAHLSLAAIALTATPWRERRWAALGATLACYLTLALWQQRWIGYAQLLAILPCAALLARWPARTPAPFAVAAAVALSLAPLLAAAALPHERRESAGGCPLTSMAEHLAVVEPAPRTVMGFIFHGPELMWRTPHAVVATPYHRNGAGIGDALDFFGATQEGAAREIAARTEDRARAAVPGGGRGRQVPERPGRAARAAGARRGSGLDGGRRPAAGAAGIPALPRQALRAALRFR